MTINDHVYLPQGDDEPHQVHDHADMAEPALDAGPPSFAAHPLVNTCYGLPLPYFVFICKLNFVVVYCHTISYVSIEPGPDIMKTGPGQNTPNPP